MPEIDEYSKPSLAYLLSVPLSIMYILLVLVTSGSFISAAVGYLIFSISIGLFQSRLKYKRPYRIAFLSVSLIPLIAYLFFLLSSVLLLLGIWSGLLVREGTEPQQFISGNAIEISPFPYVERLGLSEGIIVYVGVLIALIIVFGLIGTAGRYLGDELEQEATKRLAERSKSKTDTKIRSMQNSESGLETVQTARIENISAKITLAAAVISLLVSILIPIL